MALNLTSLNQRMNYIVNLINQIIAGVFPMPTNSPLSIVLSNGNNAGTNNIDMNDNKLLQCSEITASNNIIVSSNNLKLTNNKVAILQNAGVSNQGNNSVSIGPQSGNFEQNSNSIAIGNESGRNQQNTNSIAIGTQSGYSQQSSHSVSIGSLSGENNQSTESISIGRFAGRNNQNTQSVCIGSSSGNLNQGSQSVAIGRNSGQNNQGNRSIAIGNSCASNSQGLLSIALGENSGQNNKQQYSISIGAISAQNNQGENSIAIGRVSAQNNQGNNSIALGFLSGSDNQGSNCVAIGQRSGQINQHNNSIVLNATGTALNTNVSNSFYVSPIRNATQMNVLGYDVSTGEITHYISSSQTLSQVLSAGNTANNSIILDDSANNYSSDISPGTILLRDDNVGIQLELVTDGNQDTDPFIRLKNQFGLNTQIKYAGIYADGNNCFNLDNDVKFFKQHNPMSFNYEELNDGDYIEKYFPFVYCRNLSGIKLYPPSDYLDDNSNAGWSCIVSNHSNSNLNIDTNSVDWYSHSNNAGSDPIVLKKFVTCRITLIYSNVDSAYFWAVSEF